MRAIVFDQHGGTEVLQRHEVLIPQVRGGEEDSNGTQTKLRFGRH